jgi:hypothetical protein
MKPPTLDVCDVPHPRRYRQWDPWKQRFGWYSDR